MKRTSAQLKQLALDTLNTRWTMAIFSNLITGFLIGFIPFIFNFFVLGSNSTNPSNLILSWGILFVFTLISFLFVAGLQYFYLNMCRNKEYSLSDLFWVFKNHPDRFLFAGLLTSIMSLICTLPNYILTLLALDNNFRTPVSLGLLSLFSLLGLVGSVMISLFFALVIPLLIDNNELTTIGAFKTSFKLMKGNKGRLFYIQLSFIGLLILCLFTCSIGAIWATPYMSVTLVYFYLDVTGELDRTTSPIGMDDPTEFFNPYHLDLSKNPYPNQDASSNEENQE